MAKKNQSRFDSSFGHHGQNSKTQQKDYNFLTVGSILTNSSLKCTSNHAAPNELWFYDLTYFSRSQRSKFVTRKISLLVYNFLKVYFFVQYLLESVSHDKGVTQKMAVFNSSVGHQGTTCENTKMAIAS